VAAISASSATALETTAARFAAMAAAAFCSATMASLAAFALALAAVSFALAERGDSLMMGAFGFDRCCECCESVPDTPEPVFLDALPPVDRVGEPMALFPAVEWEDADPAPCLL
jgi:hypothetical protein